MLDQFRKKTMLAAIIPNKMSENLQSLINEYNGNFSELRKIINSWNLMPSYSKNYFENLIKNCLILYTKSQMSFKKKEF